MSSLYSDVVGIALVAVALLFGYVLRRANSSPTVPVWTRSESLLLMNVTVMVSLLAFGVALLLKANLG